MTDNIPNWWELFLLTGASFRVFRLLAADVILDKPRDWIVCRDEWEAKEGYREQLDLWLHCPWCLGFWITMLIWGLWLLFPSIVLFCAVPLTINAIMALVAKHLDA